MAGSLIEIHYHANFAVLEELSEVDGNLYYKDAPIFIQVSKEKTNAIIKKLDGIYVDNSYFLNEKQFRILTRFDFYNGILAYNGREISWDYTEDQLNVLHKQIWNELNKKYTLSHLPDNTFATSDKRVFMTKDKQVFTGGDK